MKPSPVASPAASHEANTQEAAYTRKQARIAHKKFRIPRVELDMLNALKLRAKALQLSTTKSELVRAGLMALDNLTDPQLQKALGKLPSAERTQGRRTH